MSAYQFYVLRKTDSLKKNIGLLTHLPSGMYGVTLLYKITRVKGCYWQESYYRPLKNATVHTGSIPTSVPQFMFTFIKTVTGVKCLTLISPASYSWVLGSVSVRTIWDFSFSSVIWIKSSENIELCHFHILIYNFGDMLRRSPYHWMANSVVK